MRLVPLKKMLACFMALCLAVTMVPLVPQRASAEPVDADGCSYPEEFVVSGEILSEVPDGWTGIYTAEDLSKAGGGR